MIQISEDIPVDSYKQLLSVLSKFE